MKLALENTFLQFVAIQWFIFVRLTRIACITENLNRHKFWYVLIHRMLRFCILTCTFGLCPPPEHQILVNFILAKADCPVCGIEIATTVINAHLDSCLAREEKKNSLRKNTPKRIKRYF